MYGDQRVVTQMLTLPHATVQYASAELQDILLCLTGQKRSLPAGWKSGDPVPDDRSDDFDDLLDIDDRASAEGKVFDDAVREADRQYERDPKNYRPGYRHMIDLAHELEQVENAIGFQEGMITKFWVGLLATAYAVLTHYLQDFEEKGFGNHHDGSSGTFEDWDENGYGNHNDGSSWTWL